MMWISMESITSRLRGNIDADNQTPANEVNISIWNYAKTFLKGVGILAIGGITYTFFRTWKGTEPQQNVQLVSQNHFDTPFNLLETSESGENVRRDVLPFSGKRTLMSMADTVTSVIQNSTLIKNVVKLNNDEFLLVWQISVTPISGQGLSFIDIYTQRIGADLKILEPKALVNPTTINDASGGFRNILLLTNGNFIVVWQISSFRSDMAFRIFSNENQPLSDVIIFTSNNVNNNNMQLSSAPIDDLGDEKFIVTWLSIDNTVSLIYNNYAQVFDYNGATLGTQFLLNNFTLNGSGSYSPPNVIRLTNSSFAIGWTVSDQSVASNYMQYFAVNGTALTSEYVVNNQTYAGIQLTPLANNKFIVSWSETNQWSSPTQLQSDIFGKIFTIDGEAVTEKFLLATNTSYAVIQKLSTDGFVAVKEILILHNTANLTYISGLYAQQYDGNGTPLNNEYTVDNIISVVQPEHNITFISPPFFFTSGLADNNFLITWDRFSQLYGTFFNYHIIQAEFFTVNYQTPLLMDNQLIIAQNQTVGLNENNLIAYGSNYDALMFLTRNVRYGAFAKIDQPAVSIFNFTQTDLTNGFIQFQQDGSYNAPTYEIAISNRINQTEFLSATIDFLQKPRFLQNQFSIKNGQVIKLSAGELLSIVDNGLDVTFEIQSTNHGVFTLNEVQANLATALVSFTQAQINASQIFFAHDGSNIAPGYTIRASSRGISSELQASQISFSTAKDNKKIIGAAVGASAGALLLAGLGIFAGYRYKKAKSYAEERAKYPLADALYKVLPIEGAANFKSAKGIAFVNAVNAIEGYLKVDIQQMIPEELAELADKLARAIKAQVTHTTGLLSGIELNLADVEYQAEAIAQTTQTLNSPGILASHANEIEMTTVNKKSGLGKLASRLQQRGIDIDGLKPAELDKLADIIADTIDDQVKPTVHMNVPN